MNRKDPGRVVQAEPRVEGAAVEQAAPQPRTAMVGGEPRGEQQSESAACPGQVQGALKEQLVAVGVAVALGGVDARGTEKTSQRYGALALGIAVHGRAGVGAHHVPRWISKHGVKAAIAAPAAMLIEEHLGEGQLPVKYRVVSSHRRRL